LPGCLCATKGAAKPGGSTSLPRLGGLGSAKELRNNVGAVLRRAQAGEQITITVAGRPVAQLGPAGRREWVSGPALQAVWNTTSPRRLDGDLERFPASLGDPSAR
jgi:prevent-host-death family protein